MPIDRSTTESIIRAALHALETERDPELRRSLRDVIEQLKKMLD